MKCTDNAYPAKVHYTFWLPSGDGHWGLNFNSAVYPGSTNAVIRRAIDGVHWTVESYGVGELLSWGHSGLKRPQSGPSHEGFYQVNFRFHDRDRGPTAERPVSAAVTQASTFMARASLTIARATNMRAASDEGLSSASATSA